MTTKLPDAPQRAPFPHKELPPDPMLRDETVTVATNYLMRVNGAVPADGATAGSLPTSVAAALFHAALAFESDIRLISMNQLVDPLEGTPYAGGPVVLDAPDLDIQQITNSLIPIANWVVSTLGVKDGPLETADLRTYVQTRASVRYILESVAIFR